LAATATVPRRYRHIDERFVAGHTVSLLRNGSQAFPAMLAAIDSAERQVLLEMYWFGSDTTGRTFAQALIRAARRGVEVAVLFDSLGSIEADSSMFDEMRAEGVRVVEFNPVRPWHQRFRVEALTRRDHRKILVVDARIGFTGGINLADQWAPEEVGGGGWRDDMVRVEGPGVSGFIECFRSGWEEEDGGPLAALPVASSSASNGSGPSVRVLGNEIHRERREIVRAYLYQIYRAHRRVWIANPYFVPDRRILRALELAALRGVDVRVILPGKSDVEVVRLASRAMYERLMKASIRIFEWQHHVLHQKSAVIDGRWSTTGTFNLDYRSIRINLEVNLAVLDEGFGATMEESFRADFAASREVSYADFSRRSLLDRALSATAYRFKNFL
jgi:cardiolipin synthase